MYPVYSDDPYLARIPAEVVTPPHTATSVKRCISYVESVGREITTNLFLSASHPAPMGDADRVSIIAIPGPGYSPKEPMALATDVFYTNLLDSEQRRQPPTNPTLWPWLTQPLNTPSRGDTSPLKSQYRKF
jgi:hypothetical protein